MTGRVRDMIIDPDETGKLCEVIAEGSYYGMQTFDQSLLQLYQRGQDLARAGARPPPRTRTTSSCWSQSRGSRSTSVDQLYNEGRERRRRSEPSAAAEQPTPARFG